MVASVFKTIRWHSILLGLIALSRASTDISGDLLTDIKGVTPQNDVAVEDSRFLVKNTEKILVMRALEITCVEKGAMMLNWVEPEANFSFDPKDVTYHLFAKPTEDYAFEASSLDELIEIFEQKKRWFYYEIKGQTEKNLEKLKATNKMYSVLVAAQVGDVLSDFAQSMNAMVHSIVPKTGNYTYSHHVDFEADEKLEVTTNTYPDRMRAKITFEAIGDNKLPKKFMQIAVNTTVTGTASDGEVLVRKVEQVKFKKDAVIVTGRLSDASELLSRLQVDSVQLAGAVNETDNGRNEVRIFDITIESSTRIFDGLTFETLFNLFSRIRWGFSINWRCNRVCPCFGGCCFCINTPNGVRDVYAILIAGFRAEAKFVFFKEFEHTLERSFNLFSSSTRAVVVWAGIVPVIFTYSFSMDLELELVLKASIEATLGAWMEGNLEMGFRQRGSGSSFDPVKTATFDDGLWLPQDTFKATFSLDADAGLHLSATVLVYHLIGGRIGVKPGIAFSTGGEVTSSGLSTTHFDLDLYLKMPFAFVIAQRDVFDDEFTLFTLSLLPSARNIFDGATGLGWCQGDCDIDGDCNTGFRCFQRSGSEPLISCQGRPSNRWDYCVPMFIF